MYTTSKQLNRVTFPCQARLRRFLLFLTLFVGLSVGSSVTAQTIENGIFDPEMYHRELSRWEMQTVIDSLWVRLSAEPKWVGLIVVYSEPDETRKQRVARVAKIQKSFAYRKYDISRIYLAFEKASTRLGYTILPGEKLFPLKETEYTIFKLSDLLKKPDVAFLKSR